MKTLYDLLGALPGDDAEGLRAAFRQAVKGAHPDINPGDPEAARRFREIVRANEILSDEEQRAAYDHLLDFARLEQESESKRAIAAAVHRFSSYTLALCSVSALTVAGYLLLIHVSAASVGPLNELGTNPAVAWLQPSGAGNGAAKKQSAIASEGANTSSAVTAPDRDIKLDHQRRLDRAFAEIAAANSVRKASRSGPAKRPRVQARAKPIPAARTAERDLSREEGFPFVTVR
jgi:curved DNA-binding protein CbpA